MIARVLRIGTVLWAAAALGALPFGRDAWLGVLVGGALGLGNFYGLARIVSAAARARGRRAAWLGVLLAAKFALLCALVFVVLRHLGVAPIAFLVGVSVFVVAIFAASARRALGAA